MNHDDPDNRVVLKKRVVFVTGGGRGIGAATVRLTS